MFNLSNKTLSYFLLTFHCGFFFYVLFILIYFTTWCDASIFFDRDFYFIYTSHTASLTLYVITVAFFNFWFTVFRFILISFYLYMCISIFICFFFLLIINKTYFSLYSDLSVSNWILRFFSNSLFAHLFPGYFLWKNVFLKIMDSYKHSSLSTFVFSLSMFPIAKVQAPNFERIKITKNSLDQLFDQSITGNIVLNSKEQPAKKSKILARYYEANPSMQNFKFAFSDCNLQAQMDIFNLQNKFDKQLALNASSFTWMKVFTSMEEENLQAFIQDRTTQEFLSSYFYHLQASIMNELNLKNIKVSNFSDIYLAFPFLRNPASISNFHLSLESKLPSIKLFLNETAPLCRARVSQSFVVLGEDLHLSKLDIPNSLNFSPSERGIAADYISVILNTHNMDRTTITFPPRMPYSLIEQTFGRQNCKAIDVSREWHKDDIISAPAFYAKLLDNMLRKKSLPLISSSNRLPIPYKIGADYTVFASTNKDNLDFSLLFRDLKHTLNKEHASYNITYEITYNIIQDAWNSI